MSELNERTLQAIDTVHGALGRAYINIDGSREELLYAKNVDVNFEKTKIGINVLGTVVTKHRTGGWTGTGSMVIYYCTSLFRRLAHKYAKTGQDIYFEMVLENNDPGSNIGRQSILLKNVNLDDTSLFLIDVDAEVLEEDISFTYEDFEILEEFNPVAGE